MALRIAINGFGRIGRSVARIVSKRDDVELVAINDLADPKTLEYLTNFDSVHGPLDEEALVEGNVLRLGGQSVEIFREPDPENLRFADAGADVVLECSGRFLRSEIVQTHIRHGAKRVVISAPAEDDTPTYVFGVNAHSYKGEAIISNASCTTNCLGPIARVIDEIYGIKTGLMTTIHAYTGGQSLMDAAISSDMRRCRAAAVNLVPTSTHAAEAIYKVLPNLKGKLHGQSVRVPTPDVSLMDLNLVLEKPTSAEEVNLLFLEKAKGELRGILGIDEKFGVSQDFCGDTRSGIVATDLTQVIGGNMLKIMAWYDNEWGYANRLVDMALHISK
ncbi:type I glyceraldehyde-3-phosphate dehydrogenase [Hydrogenimonas cancrithermarum]|uniref:Glyceraldehyde-3-phosphate dehydrogenase n=1 Tax=Hydrogenimonas cancrithermarum TaxID=2993563 RepID=A0ABM8FK74_9BACT|nr:type I glyceraldehyde-3-phosphate dehydrogenase [Hydrogenimonas cancrithermarum]BDY12719.1 glyceraldehyde-3-phosphate dehydrogenase [Hydrogenimonas cancrithermarum]